MQRRHFMMLPGAAFLMVRGSAAQTKRAAGTGSSDLDRVLPDQLLLKDYRPKSIYKIPKSETSTLITIGRCMVWACPTTC